MGENVLNILLTAKKNYYLSLSLTVSNPSSNFQIPQIFKLKKGRLKNENGQLGVIL